MLTSKQLKIYIAGPYTAATEQKLEENVNLAIDAAFVILDKGHFPFIPHLTHFVDKRANERGIKLTWEDYIRWDTVWAELCDALLYLGSSKGADLELKLAIRLGKTIYRSLDDIPSVTTETQKNAAEG